MKELQALNFSLERAQKFCSGIRGHFYGENVCYWNLAEGTTAKAQGTKAIAMGTMGYYFKALDCTHTSSKNHRRSLFDVICQSARGGDKFSPVQYPHS